MIFIGKFFYLTSQQEIEEQERWSASNMDRSLTPSALGQTLVRQVQWLRDVLAIRHTGQNRVSPDGQFLGRNAEEGFLGLLMAQEVVNTLVALDERLQVEVPREEAAKQIREWMK